MPGVRGSTPTLDGVAPPDAPPDDLVWHYTDAHGLLSIVRTDTLWATSAQFLNDAGEVAMAVELLRREVLRRAAAGEGGPYRDVAGLIERSGRSHAISPASFYVLSAATQWDLLAMWRSYGGRGASRTRSGSTRPRPSPSWPRSRTPDR